MVPDEQLVGTFFLAQWKVEGNGACLSSSISLCSVFHYISSIALNIYRKPAPIQKENYWLRNAFVNG